MKTVLVLGGRGLAGDAVVEQFLKDGYRVFATYAHHASPRLPQAQNLAFKLEQPPYAPSVQKLYSSLQELQLYCHPDVVVNCLRDDRHLWLMAAGLPHLLSNVFAGPIVHISTNAVFPPGTKYNTVDSPVLPQTEYGLAKLLGESEKQLVIRTSFVGFPTTCWDQCQWGHQLQFDRLWNGVTTKRLARFIVDRTSTGNLLPQVLHLCSPAQPWREISELLHIRAKKLKISVPHNLASVIFRETLPLLLQGIEMEPLEKQIGAL